MIETQNLPFSYEDYFSEAQNLEQLRENIKSIVQRDIDTLEGLLNSVQETLTLSLDPQGQARISDLKKKQIEFDLFKQLSEQNRERSESLTGLARLVLHMVDYIEQSQHRYTYLAQTYEREIDTLRQTIDDLRNGKSLIENDVQIFKEQLQRTRLQLDVLVEEKEEEDEYQIQIELDTEEKNEKITLMQKELASLTSKLNFYKETRHNKSGFTPQRISTLRQTYSEHHFTPFTPSAQTAKTQNHSDYSHYVEFNKVLMAENNQLRRKIDELEQIKLSINMKETASSETYQQGQIYLIENDQSECSAADQKDRFEEEDRTLKQIRSKQSFSSHLDRNNSNNTLYLESKNSEKPRKRLSSEVGELSQEYDLVPEHMGQHHPNKKLIYLTDDEISLSHDLSRQRFDCFLDKTLQTVFETKQSDISVKACHKKSSHSILTIKPKMGNPSKFMTVPRQNVPEAGVASGGKKREEKLKQTEKGLGSSLFQFFVNRRVRRTSTRANSGCSTFLF